MPLSVVTCPDIYELDTQYHPAEGEDCYSPLVLPNISVPC